MFKKCYVADVIQTNPKSEHEWKYVGNVRVSICFWRSPLRAINLMEKFSDKHKNCYLINVRRLK